MRARIVTAGDAERRKIERDLHDGAQQHLVALSIRVGLASEVADPEVAERLDEWARSSTRFCRSSATSPMASTRLCFASWDSRRPWPALVAAVGFTGEGRGRQRSAATPKTSRPPSTSAARKVSRTSTSTPGRGATAVIRLWERDGQLFFEIVDDGVGFDVESARARGRTGSANMSDRIAAHRGNPGARVGAGTGYDGPGGHPDRDAATQRGSVLTSSERRSG